MALGCAIIPLEIIKREVSVMSEKSIRIGCAIPFALFRQKEGSAPPILAEAFGGTEAVLDFCAEAVDAVELRAVKGGDSPDAVLDAVRRLTARGLEVTIHGSLSDAETFFAPYLPLLASGLQARYNVTVHPLSDAESTERVLRGICREITQKGYPIRLTLENQRMKEGGLYGKCFEVAEMARRIDSPVLSLCFDFGHQLSNDRKGFGDETSHYFSR